MNTSPPPAAAAYVRTSSAPNPFSPTTVTHCGLTHLQKCILDYQRLFVCMNDQIAPSDVVAREFDISVIAAVDALRTLHTAGHLAINELGNYMLASPPRNMAAPLHLRALQRLAEGLLNPDQHGYSVPPQVRDDARFALGLPTSETHKY